ncbi:hypothetical protein L5515_010323 [Caenorhabditis briggsae]|uniref:Uncharacterized protein n=1 Tax=Caenorhabditis briggsae TaxID=6238 RepID=A0AAE9ERK9_CAEBR|nr:hypothetical protein L5515_010323 [Caenorhabditis briggsae]
MVHKHLQDSHESLTLYARYEFLKRNPVLEAHRNFCEMLTSEKRDNASNTLTNCRPVDTTAIMFYGTCVEKPEEVNPEEDSDTDSEDLNPPKEQFKVNFHKKDLSKFYEKFYEEKHKTESIKNVIAASGVLERLYLRTLSGNFLEYVKKSKFPISHLRTTRAYGKVKLQFHDKGKKKIQNLEYWRSDKYRTLIWRNYHARLDGSRRFQQLAARNVFQMTRCTPLDEIEFKTEPYSSWNVAFEPFDKFYYILADCFLKSLVLKMNAKKFSMDITWSTPQDNNPKKEPLLVLLNLMKPEAIEHIKLRKWDDWHIRENRKTRIMRHFSRKVRQLEQWRMTRKLDILDKNIQVLPEDYIVGSQAETIRVGLKEKDVYELCELVRQRRFPFFLTMTVNDDFDYLKAVGLLAVKRDIKRVPPFEVNENLIKVSYRLGNFQDRKSLEFFMDFDNAEWEGKKENKIFFHIKDTTDEKTKN